MQGSAPGAGEFILSELKGEETIWKRFEDHLPKHSPSMHIRKERTQELVSQAAAATLGVNADVPRVQSKRLLCGALQLLIWRTL